MTHASKNSEAQMKARLEALEAAERSGMMEGLPPVSSFAREQGLRYAKGEITADEAVAAILQHYSQHSDGPTRS